MALHRHPPMLEEGNESHWAERAGDLEFARKHLLSIKKEVERGTPVDPEIIVEMEAVLDRLEHRLVADEEQALLLLHPTAEYRVADDLASGRDL
jgi:hypothetical protein